MNEFVRAFDAYAEARAQLRQMSEDSPEYGGWLDHCSSLWARLCETRKAIEVSHEC